MSVMLPYLARAENGFQLPGVWQP